MPLRRSPVPSALLALPAPPASASSGPVSPRPVPRPGWSHALWADAGPDRQPDTRAAHALTRLAGLIWPVRLTRLAGAALTAAGLATAGGQALANTGECRLAWEVQPVASAGPGPGATTGTGSSPGTGFSVRLQFDAGGRSLTNLRLPGGWAAVQPAAGQPDRLQPVADDPQLRQVRHGPNERVDLRWEFRPDPGTQAGGVLQTERWFAFTGGTLLAWPDELAAQTNVPVCVTVTAPPGTARLVSSFGLADAAQTQWRTSTSLGRWQRALFAGGAWQWRELGVTGHQTMVAMPEQSPFGFGIDTLARSVAADLAALRQPWGAPNEAVPMLMLMLPGSTGPAGLALHRAMVVQAPPAMPLPGPRFDELLAAQWHRTWLPERLGPMSHLGRGDAALRAWFTEGLADFLTHRWLLREGRWTLGDYADALNRKIAAYQALPELNANNLRVVTGRAGPEALALLPAARGEFLALAWHQALRRAGHPGLEQLLYGLVVPAAQAQPEGSTSTPLATHRVLAALRRPLGDQALQWQNQHIEDGQPFSFGPQTLGPCFQLESDGPARYKPADQAMNRPDCVAWLKGGAAGPRELQAAGPADPAANAAAAGSTGSTGAAMAAAAAAGAGAVAATRQVCKTIAPPKPKKGAKPGQAKPRTVCRTVAAAPAQADAADATPAARAGSRAQAAAGAKPPRTGAKAANRAGAPKPGANAGAKPTTKPANKAAAKPAAQAAKPGSKPAAR